MAPFLLLRDACRLGGCVRSEAPTARDVQRKEGTANNNSVFGCDCCCDYYMYSDDYLAPYFFLVDCLNGDLTCCCFRLDSCGELLDCVKCCEGDDCCKKCGDGGNCAGCDCDCGDCGD